jgi:hypothetical protein
MRGYLAQVRRAGFDIGLSSGKLARAMVDVLLQLPPEAAPSKELVVERLGLLGQMSKTRDINAAWNKPSARSCETTPAGSVSTARSCARHRPWRIDPGRGSRPPAIASSPLWLRRKG